MTPRCVNHPAVEMVQVQRRPELRMYGKAKPVTHTHYKCPVPSCRFVATIEIPQPELKPKRVRKTVARNQFDVRRGL